ncbi:MAG TPA: hypothetical protein VMV73_00080, partial [Candidatus Dormibacteraeota bacterium]|nr:hypothetical protein [Candidatus Dormibacteraeota bacterium]
MPLILTQHFSRDHNRYLDREGYVYHFPRSYIPIVKKVTQETGDFRFLYQRPVKGAPRGQAGTYFGYGTLSEPYEDAQTPNHFWLDIVEYYPLRPVPLRNDENIYYESGRERLGILQGRSIRYIEPMRYFAILAAGQAYSIIPETSQPTNLQDSGLFTPGLIPKDSFREMLVVPPGIGYVPHGDEMPDKWIAAGLHERARRDHQHALDVILRQVQRCGGSALYNNHVDLFARVDEQRYLVEAKSLP